MQYTRARGGGLSFIVYSTRSRGTQRTTTLLATKHFPNESAKFNFVGIPRSVSFCMRSRHARITANALLGRSPHKTAMTVNHEYSGSLHLRTRQDAHR